MRIVTIPAQVRRNAVAVRVKESPEKLEKNDDEDEAGDGDGDERIGGTWVGMTNSF